MHAGVQESALREDLSGASRAPGEWAGAWPQSSDEFEAFIDVFQDRLVYFALRQLGNIQDAEDVIQEVLVKAYVRRESLSRVERVVSYLYRMAANACRDFQRRRQVGAPISLEELEGVEIVDPRAGAAEVVAALEEARRIEGLLSRLPNRQAEVVRLRVFDDLTLPDVARALGVSLPTVKSRLRYGFQKLRKWLGRERGES
jgi:RNA polymerase sigma-70 factor, ECF subfamily